MSKLCDQVIEVVRNLFPEIKIKTEEFVFYENQRLFLDIWVPQLNLVIEVHGNQHEKFVEHFHGNIANFKASKKRDRLKEEWADKEGYTFVLLKQEDLPVTPEELLETIIEASNNG
jgi:very-short-patch-repair endonuclease